MGTRKGVPMSVEALAALGAERLAELLHTMARDEPRLRPRLEEALRRAPPDKAGAVGAMLDSVERRLAALEGMHGYRDWRGAASVGADIDSIREDVVRGVLPVDPEAAADRLERLVDLADDLFETNDDSDGEISGALGAVVEDWGRAWARVAGRDHEEIAEIVFDAYTGNEYGVLDFVIPAFADALSAAGLDVLERRFRATLDRGADPGDRDDEARDADDDGADWRAETREQMLFRGLRHIADLRGDVDAFIAVHEEAGTEDIYAVGIAERLYRAGRPEEALRWLERPDRRKGFAEDVTDLHVAILEALGRDADARAVRWRAFEETLSFEHYDACRQKTPQHEREAVRRRAIDHALGGDEIHGALEFLVAVDALAEAAELVLRRKADLRGHDYWTLRPVAEALAADHPVAAVVLYRLLTEAVLRAGRSPSYKYAIADLRTAARLADRVDDWERIEPHEPFMARLRAEHGRKWSFWKQW